MVSSSQVKVGNSIFYPQYGVAKIIKITNREFDGKMMKYAIMEVRHADIEISIPIQNFDKVNIRALSSPKVIDDVLSLFGGKETKKNKVNWSHKHKENNERINSGDIFEVATVLNDLTLLSFRKSLSTSDKRLLQKARDFIIDEIATVKKLSHEEVNKIINAYFEKTKDIECKDKNRKCINSEEEVETNSSIAKDSESNSKKSVTKTKASTKAADKKSANIADPVSTKDSESNSKKTVTKTKASTKDSESNSKKTVTKTKASTKAADKKSANIADQVSDKTKPKKK